MIAITRRHALIGAGRLTLAGSLALAGCGSQRSAAPSGSTLISTWHDPTGDGQLRLGPGEPLLDRLELGPRATSMGGLATFAHLTDAHVLDPSSPARVPFLDRLGPPFQSTFRPQEALTAQVLDGALRAVRALRPEAVIQGGDLIDNDQSNELERALALLRGAVVDPGSGRQGYFGVQSARDADPFYYRPDLDAPRHPGLLQAASRGFRGAGLGTPWYPVLGDHDVLVAGELVPTELTRSLAVGTRALWDLPHGLSLPPGTKVSSGGSPDGPPLPSLVDSLLSRALAGPTVTVPPDPARRQLSVAEVIAGLRAGSRLDRTAAVAEPDRLDYSVDLGSSVRLLVLDLARRAGGSGGLVVPGQAEWTGRELASAGDRWVLVVSHQPLASSAGGEAVLSVLDGHPRVVAALSGHTHRNLIEPRRTATGGYWLISTASLIDYPQQARALRLSATEGGGVALRTWMLDHVGDGALGGISRELSYLDAEGGRPLRFAGSRLDRNVTLYRAAPRQG